MSKDEKKLIARASQRMALSRTILFEKAPYISTTAYGFIPYIVPGLADVAPGPVAVTKGLVLMADPVWVLEVTAEQLAGVFCHEAWHILNDMERLEALMRINKDFAGLSADIAINGPMVKAGWDLPEPVLPADFDFPEGKTMEEYFELFQQKYGGKNNNGDGTPKAEKICRGCCGGVMGNPIDEVLEAEADKAFGRSELDVERIKEQTKTDINKHETSYGRGSIPGGMVELAKVKKRRPLIDWKIQLNRVIRKTTGRMVSGRSDFSLKRPSKRSFLRSILRPGMVDRKPEIALIEDTSGSMRKPQLHAARNEEIAILERLGVDEVWHLQADVSLACNPHRARIRDLPIMNFYGRGGTSFVHSIMACERLRPKPDIIIYLTDGDGTAARHPPRGIEVVWCIVPSPYQSRPAPWGHLVVCSNDREEREAYGVY